MIIDDKNRNDWVSAVLQHGVGVLLPKQRTNAPQEKESEVEAILRGIRERRNSAQPGQSRERE